MVVLNAALKKTDPTEDPELPEPAPEPVAVPAESIFIQVVDFLLDVKAVPVRLTNQHAVNSIIVLRVLKASSDLQQRCRFVRF